MSNRGQVMVEALVALSLMMVILLGLTELIPNSAEQQQLLVLERDRIWSRTPGNRSLQASSDYPIARASGRLLSPLSELTSLDFEYNNFWQTRSPNSRYPMARIIDSWSAESQQQLDGRPASLVVNSLLSGQVTRFIQDVVAGTPITEELSSDSLIFGHIDSDVVPEAALQER